MQHDLDDLPQLLGAEHDAMATVIEVRADYEAATLRLVLRVQTSEGIDEPRAIACDGVADWHLVDECFDTVRLHERHPALMRFVDERVDLYFTGVPLEPQRTADALMATTTRIAGRFVAQDTILNDLGGDLARLLRHGYGKVASGPATLLRVLQGVLERDGLRTSVISRGSPSTEDDAAGPLAVLELGRSWVVGRAFRCARPYDAPP